MGNGGKEVEEMAGTREEVGANTMAGNGMAAPPPAPPPGDDDDDGRQPTPQPAAAANPKSNPTSRITLQRERFNYLSTVGVLVLLI